MPVLSRLDTGRLRATWLAGCADLLGLATFMHAAGISCSQRPVFRVSSQGRSTMAICITDDEMVRGMAPRILAVGCSGHARVPVNGPACIFLASAH